MRNVLAVALMGFFVTAPAFAAPSSPSQKTALAELLKRSEATHSDAMVIWQDGHEIGHYYKGGKAPGPIELMSVTKSVVALGIAQLVADGKIKSFDQPVADFYPEWLQGQKATITLRMLMNHTSGMQNFPRTDVEVYPAPDAIQLALAAEIVSKPGTNPNYNNKAVNLLAGIIEKASGKPMDTFFSEGLFKPMGIHPGPWERDKTGHPYAMSGLPLTAEDLGKLGQLILDKGQWQGKQLLPAAMVDELLKPQHDDEMGLLWWRDPAYQHFDYAPASMDRLRKSGVSEGTIAKLQKGLQGTHFDDGASAREGVVKALGPDGKTILKDELVSRGIGPYALFKMTTGPAVSFSGNGDGGQYVVVVPSAKIVAVRQIDAGSDDEQPDEGFPDFGQRVMDVAGPSAKSLGLK
ncbi:beta-lactamase family protein [Luteibacter pinisoli]|uniref:Beta-lactamase family protein n=1 Tax=Luteibacter pinisoli TaxID=2589080 RepID=A0A4Y5Z3U4_9GAMM|nr:serine hydrolase [Luteibacter pinisoli]QDE39764.1 beta-lactamase family protein [Luteibacter pinisoli]